MEHWIEANLNAPLADQNKILLEVLRPFVRRVERDGALLTWHYFREPEIRFRLRLGTRREKERQRRGVSKIGDRLQKEGLVTEWHFGSHGEEGIEYTGEEDRYGKNGWKVAQEYFRNGSETALRLLELRRRSRLESPLWARGLGNPWEGGELNPWRERDSEPLAYHWSRFVHLFSNQLGYDMEKEAGLCSKQAERYLRVTREFGMRW